MTTDRDDSYREAHIMGQAEIDKVARQVKRRRVLGEAATCAWCGWTDQTALTKSNDRVLCYECRCGEDGKATTEEHHVLGKDNDATTIPVPGNLHRGLSDRQLDWPAEVRRNPGRDPLLWLVGGFLSLVDHVTWWVGVAPKAAQWAVELVAALRRVHGEAWWTALGIPSLWEAIAA